MTVKNMNLVLSSYMLWGKPLGNVVIVNAGFYSNLSVLGATWENVAKVKSMSDTPEADTCYIIPLLRAEHWSLMVLYIHIKPRQGAKKGQSATRFEKADVFGLDLGWDTGTGYKTWEIPVLARLCVSAIMKKSIDDDAIHLNIPEMPSLEEPMQPALYVASWCKTLLANKDKLPDCLLTIDPTLWKPKQAIKIKRFLAFIVSKMLIV